MKDLDVLEQKLRKRISNFDEKFAEAKIRLDLAVKIAKEREKAGITQKEFANRLHTTQSVISRIESGNQNLSIEMLQKIAKALGKERVAISFR